MSETVTKLLERRDAALKAYEDFVQPLIDAGTALTAEQDEQRSALKAGFELFDARIDEVRKQEAREAELAEARTTLTAVTDVAVTNEPTTYGEGSPNSYFADLCRSYSPAFKTHFEAVARLSRASHELEVDLATAAPTEARAIERVYRNAYRDDAGTARRAISEARERGRAAGPEMRTGLTTAATSGGSFVTPVYYVSKYAPFRQPGRAFADACNKQPLPEYGMTVYLPHVTAAAGVASQATQNTTITETDPNAGYLSANLVTEAGEVTVSQQLLDRAGPNFAFDVMVFDQLNRAYAPKIDTYILTQALAGAQGQTYTTTTFKLTATSGVGGFYGIVSGAKAAVRTASGVVMNPTHLFLTPTRWEFITAWSDAQGRPVVVPDYAGAFNAFGAGSPDGNIGVEGPTGYRFNGLPVFQDLNIPAPGTGADQAIVGNLSEVWYWEGDPVTRVLPQTLGKQLSVLLQLYSYVAAIVPYPHAVQAISGTGMHAIVF